MSCCQNISKVACAIEDILNRIEPIQYTDDVALTIASPILVQSPMTIDNQSLNVGSGGVLSLPNTATINGSPLNGLPFTGDILNLPDQTTINGFSLLTTNYFYFFNTTNASYTSSGSYIICSNILTTPGPPPALTNNIKYPFFVPENCILTSFIFSFAVSSSGASTISNVNAYLEMISPSGVVTNTGIFVTIPSCPSGTKYFADKTFQYPVNKGFSIGVRFTYSGTSGGSCQFATLGYKFLPPV